MLVRLTGKYQITLITIVTLRLMFGSTISCVCVREIFQNFINIKEAFVAYMSAGTCDGLG